MAKFMITVPVGGYDGTNPDSSVTLENRQFTTDRGLGRKVTPRILRATFGDGYEQRVKDGINIKEDSFNVSFKNRSSTEINKLAAFFDTYAGKNFVLTITDYTGDTELKVVCDTYNINYQQPTVHSLSCTLRRVYEP